MPQLHRFRFVMLAVWLAILATTSAVSAQPASRATIDDVILGVRGTYKVGFWTAVRVTVSAGDTDLDVRLLLTTPDGDRVPVTFVDEQSTRIPARETQSLVGFVKFGQVQAELAVELSDAVGVVAQRTFVAGELPSSLSSDRDWILTIGADLGLAQTLKSSHVTSLSDIVDLPTQWQAYEAVNTVVLSTSDLRLVNGLPPAQASALQQWVELGGRLVLCVGSQGEGALSATSPLHGLAPGTFSQVLPLRGLSSLESYVGSSQAINAVRDAGERATLVMTLLDNVRGKIYVQEQTGEGVRPIVVRTPTGLGHVVFVAVDLDQPPLSTWEGRSRLLEKLLRGESDAASERHAAQEGAGQLVHLGYNDLVGQLRSAVEQFSGVKLVPFSWVAGLIVVYLLLIGPADYFFLRDVIRRLGWTWITFPLIASLFCVVGVVLQRGFKSSEVKVNQVDLVDIDLERQFLRGTTWVHLYSPRNAAYDLRLDSPWLSSTTDQTTGNLLSWQGLPGTGLGGLETSKSSIFTPPLFTTPYRISNTAATTSIQQTPIEKSGTKALVSRWWNGTDLTSTATLHLSGDGLLRGDVMNPLPVELTDCLLLYDNWAYKLERKGNVLRPGDSARIDLEKPLNLSWRLTRRRVVEIRDLTTPWEQRDLDVPRILEMMMLHRAAGGDNYTQLHHRYQAYVDLSEHLLHGRAILLGRAKQPASDLLIDGQPAGPRYDQRWTFYRVVFPVAGSRVPRSS